jgi:hypothetical protein
MPTPGAEPPFEGTVYMSREVITEKDPSAFVTLIPNGRGWRTLYDRRTEKFAKLNVFLFQAVYADAGAIEVQVNPEFSPAEAAAWAKRFADKTGQLPAVLRRGVKFLWIHDGDPLFGGGNDGILIHVKRAAEYERAGVLEEVLFHEAAHTTLDKPVNADLAWFNAQRQDARVISAYAKENLAREDVAESVLPYYAVRFGADRIGIENAREIAGAIPARLKYFEATLTDLKPVEK